MSYRRPADKGQEEDTKPLVLVDNEIGSLPEERLPVWRKICFALGGAPYQTTNTVINFFISIFLLEVAKISPGYVSIILFVGKAWDAITDPLCGYLVYRCHSPLGKFKPWILFTAPFACGAYFCLWYVPNFSEVGKFGWYFCFYCCFQMCLSGLHVPYTSMTMAITTSQRERDTITAYRMVSEAVGVLVAVVVQGQLVSKYRKTGDCDEDTEPSDEDIENEKWSYSLGAIIVVSAYLVCACTVFFGSKENLGAVQNDTDGFFRGARQVLTFKPYILLSTGFLFNSLAIAIVQGNLALFCTHSLHMGDLFADFILVLLICSIAAMPFWQLGIRKLGKKSTFATGMIMLIPTLIAQLYIKDNQYIFYPICVIAGLSVSVALLLPWSMLPDVIDEFYLRYGTRKESIFYSFYVFFNKLSVGVGLGISQAVLALGGYETGVCEQPASVGLVLRMLVVPGPVVFTLIGLITLWKYPINEVRRAQMKKELKDRRLRQSQEQHDISQQKRDVSNSIASVSYKSLTSSTQM